MEEESEEEEAAVVISSFVLLPMFFSIYPLGLAGQTRRKCLDCFSNQIIIYEHVLLTLTLLLYTTCHHLVLYIFICRLIVPYSLEINSLRSGTLPYNISA